LIRKYFQTFLIPLAIICSLILASSSFCGTLTYEYDNLNRIVKVEKSGNYIIEYDYDAAGNRTTVTTLIQGPVYDHDADGDIDGLDLQAFASGFSGSATELSDFSNIFGSQN